MYMAECTARIDDPETSFHEWNKQPDVSAARLPGGTTKYGKRRAVSSERGGVTAVAASARLEAGRSGNSNQGRRRGK